MAQGELDIVEIQGLLPHRYPFLLVDRILELEDAKRIVGIKNVGLSSATVFAAPSLTSPIAAFVRIIPSDRTNPNRPILARPLRRVRATVPHSLQRSR